MPVHLYCLVPLRNSVAPPSGVGATTIGDFVAWTAEVTEGRIPRNVRGATAATLAHEQVIQKALARGTVIPALLADGYADPEAMRADLEACAPSITSAFELLAGRVEMTVVVGSTAPASSAETRPGRAYLEGLRSAPERSARVLSEIEARLCDIQQVATRRAEGSTVAMSSLIDPAEIARYRDTVRSVKADGATVAVDGPRSPYSFVAFSPGRGLVGALLTTA